MSVKNISEGINLNIIKTDKFKTNVLAVNFIRPLSKEEASFNALIPSVLKRGSKKYKSMDILQSKLDMLYGTSVYGNVDKKGDNHIFGLTMSFVDEKYISQDVNMMKECTDILFDILLNPQIKDNGFNTEYVEGEKKNLINKIKAQINDKRIYSINRCLEEMCKNEAYGISEIGEIENVEKITAGKLLEHYKKVLETSKIEIFFVGSEENSKGLVTRLKRKFSKISRKDIINLENTIVEKAEKIKTVEDNLNITQGKLVMGFRTGLINKDNAAAYSLFNVIFGGSPTSKLFMNVREKLSLCYYCSSRINRQKSIMYIASGIEFENKDKAYDEILSQLESVKKGEFNLEDIDNAKKYLTNAYMTLEDTNIALADFYLSRIIDKDIISPSEMARDVLKVKKDDIISCANNLTLDTVYFMNKKDGDI